MKKHFYKFIVALFTCVILVIAGNTSAQVSYYVSLNQPTAAGIEISIGQDYLISWDDNLSQPVAIDVSYDGGTNYSTLAASVTGSTWVWDTDGLAPSDQCLIKVYSTVNGSINDVSENQFKLVTDAYGEITVLQPSLSGIDWTRGTSQWISWTDNLSGTVSIELWKGTAKDSDIASGISGSTYIWDIPSGITGGLDYSVKVISDDNTDIFDESDNDFAISETIAFTIEIIKPNGGEEWARGTEHLITWMDNFDDEVDIELWKGSSKDSDIALDVTGSSYTWTVPSGQTLGTDYSVKIFKDDDHGILDESDADFEITATAGGFIEVLQPDGGESWLVGTSKLISWTDNLTGTVSIDLYKGGAWDSDIADGVSGSTYNWSIPSGQTAGSDYTVVITSDDDVTVTDVSDAEFSIVETLPGAITVLQPDVAGLIWQRGNDYWISWDDNLTVENVDVELWKGGALSATLASDVAGTTYIWSIPAGQATGDDYSIKVRGHETTTIVDESDNDFEISAYTPGGSIEVLQPNGGEEWLLNNVYLVSWVDNLNENVNLALIDYDGNTYGDEDTIAIASDVAGSTYYWDIDDATFAAGTNFKLVVYSSVDTTTFDQSDAVFSIVTTSGGEITVLQPNGGENWELNGTYWISWIDNVTENCDVDLVDYSTTPETVTSIATDVVGTTYIWTIDDATFSTGDDYKIRVSSGSVVDESDALFSIVPDMMFSVHPNPVNQTMTLDLTNMKEGTYDVVLYNQFNLAVIQDIYEAGEKVQISTSDLPNGIYFLMLKSTDGMKSQKIVVQH